MGAQVLDHAGQLHLPSRVQRAGRGGFHYRDPHWAADCRDVDWAPQLRCRALPERARPAQHAWGPHVPLPAHDHLGHPCRSRRRQPSSGARRRLALGHLAAGPAGRQPAAGHAPAAPLAALACAEGPAGGGLRGVAGSPRGGGGGAPGAAGDHREPREGVGAWEAAVARARGGAHGAAAAPGRDAAAAAAAGGHECLHVLRPAHLLHPCS
mmetsp:Transcript_46658/g.129828  ORF Transcript_46658/g.129828 Transcript_46658/m.129828 type:complete len:210 (+) Transcript_46658:139-768(+)